LKAVFRATLFLIEFVGTPDAIVILIKL
jgi:hypothetical protein